LINTIVPRVVSPLATVTINKAYGYEKDVGDKVLRAYPCSQAFALPLDKDKQRKPAHAE